MFLRAELELVHLEGELGVFCLKLLDIPTNISDRYLRITTVHFIRIDLPVRLTAHRRVILTQEHRAYVLEDGTTVRHVSVRGVGSVRMGHAGRQKR